MEKKYIARLMECPSRSFFLFGPRGVGKSTWLKEVLPNVPFFDLLDSSLYLELSQKPDALEAMAGDLPPFLRFLGIAGLLNGQLVNGQNIAREASVSRSSVDVYFSILEDTLLGYFLPAYRPNIKVREQAHLKFYWFDSGVARAAAGLLFDPVDRLWKGTALETLIYHELRVYNHIQNTNRPICFYRTGSGAEIDFVIETQKRRQTSRAHIVCVEVKSAEKWQRKWEKAMCSLAKNDRIHVDKMFGVYTGNRTYHYDGINVLPVADFLKRLHEGDVF